MSAEKEGEKMNAAKELEIFIKGIKADKATLLKLVDVIPDAYNLADLVSEAGKSYFGQFTDEERDKLKKLAEDILQKLNHAAGLKPNLGHVYSAGSS